MRRLAALLVATLSLAAVATVSCKQAGFEVGRDKKKAKPNTLLQGEAVTARVHGQAAAVYVEPVRACVRSGCLPRCALHAALPLSAARPAPTP